MMLVDLNLNELLQLDFECDFELVYHDSLEIV